MVDFKKENKKRELDPEVSAIIDLNGDGSVVLQKIKGRGEEPRKFLCSTGLLMLGD